MKSFPLIVCLLMSVLILGGCSQTKQILTGSAVPAKVGYHIHNGQEWKTLEQLDQLGATVFEEDVVFDNGARIKGGGANIVPLQIVGGTLQIAWRLTSLEYEGRQKLGGALDHAQYSIWVDGLKSKDEVSLDNNVIDSREDLSVMSNNDRYILFKYKLDKFPFYAIHTEIRGGWVVATVQ